MLGLCADAVPWPLIGRNSDSLDRTGRRRNNWLTLGKGDWSPRDLQTEEAEVPPLPWG